MCGPNLRTSGKVCSLMTQLGERYRVFSHARMSQAGRAVCAPLQSTPSRPQIERPDRCFVPLHKIRALREFTSILDWDVYNRAVTGVLRETFHNPYIFVLGTIMTESARWLKDELHQDECIHFFLDEQMAKVESTVSAQFGIAKESTRTGLAGLFDSVTFRDDRYCYPLQAADLIAWQRHRKELNLSVDCGGRAEYRRLNNATPADVHVLFPYREDGLRVFSERVEAAIRQKGLLQTQRGTD